MQQPLTAVFCLKRFLTANSALVRQFHELYDRAVSTLVETPVSWPAKGWTGCVLVLVLGMSLPVGCTSSGGADLAIKLNAAFASEASTHKPPLQAFTTQQRLAMKLSSAHSKSFNTKPKM